MKNIFTNNAIPEEYVIKKPYAQKTYLIDGELKEWNGATETVFSPIYQKNKEDKLEKTLLGYIPKLSEKEALNSLNSAFTAYDKGRGEWPTMKVEERISCIENFSKMMLETRQEVVHWLMCIFYTII